jgi:hypothetical protein
MNNSENLVEEAATFSLQYSQENISRNITAKIHLTLSKHSSPLDKITLLEFVEVKKIEFEVKDEVVNELEKKIDM